MKEEFPGLRIAVGLIFLASGLAKLPMLGAFAGSLDRTLGLGEPYSASFAGLVVALEVLVGGSLVTGIGSPWASRGGLALTAGFLLVLGRALLRHEEIECHCFGLLGIRLPNLAEFSLDSGLFLSFALLSFPGYHRSGGRVASWGILVCSLTLALTLLGRAKDGDRKMQTAIAPLLERLSDEVPAFARAEKRVLLFLTLDGLQCSICFDDMTALCDSLFRSSRRCNALLLLRGDSAVDRRAEDFARYWTQETGIPAPVLLLCSGEYDSLCQNQNYALVIGPEGSLLRAERIPMGERARLILLSALEEG